MTFNEITEKVKKDETGVAKGYSVSFLQEEFTYMRSQEELGSLIYSDYSLFKEIEIHLLSNSNPQEGDFVEYSKGKFARISRCRGGMMQLSNKIGVFVSLCGTSQASGCTWDPELKYDNFDISDLEATKETKKGRCWMFSQGISGKDRGVYFEIDFKVWSLK